jgi:hypothetical protein
MVFSCVVLVLIARIVAAFPVIQKSSGPGGQAAALAGLSAAAVVLPGLTRAYDARAKRRLEQRELADAAIDQFAGTNRPLPRVRDLADRPLLAGLHRAIPLKVPASGLHKDIPAYLRRDIDDELQGSSGCRSVARGRLAEHLRGTDSSVRQIPL